MKTSTERFNEFNPNILESVQKNFKGALEVVKDFATRRANPEARANAVAFSPSYRKSPEAIPQESLEKIVDYVDTKLGDKLSLVSDPSSKDSVTYAIVRSFLRAGIYNAHFLAKNNHSAFLQDFLEQDQLLNSNLTKISEAIDKNINGIIPANELTELETSTKSMSEASVEILAKAKQEIKTRDMREEMKLDLVEEKDKKTLRAFSFDSPKLSGDDPGVWGRSKEDGSIWMIKKPKAMNEMLSSALASKIGQFFIPDDIAQEKLITDSKGQIFLASKKIDAFETLPEARRKTDPTDKTDIYEWAHDKIDGKYKTSAVSIILGNSDGHAGNDAARSNPNNPRESIATLIDLGKSMNFTMTNSELAQLSGESKIPDKVSIGESITPTDMQRLMHGNFYKMNSPIYLNDKYVTELNNLVAKYEANPEGLNGSIREFVTELKSIAKPEDLKPLLEKISPTATFETMELDLVKAMETRMQQTKEYAENISVQIALRDNDAEKLTEIITKNPSILERKIKWLSETNENSVPKTSTIAERAAETNRSQELIDSLKTNITQEVSQKKWTERVGGSSSKDTSQSFADRVNASKSNQTQQRG